MKIGCSGPNGETFEGQTETVAAGLYSTEHEEIHEQYNRIQKALETWCEVVKASIKDAEVKS